MWSPQDVDALDVEIVGQPRRFARREDIVDVNREARVDARAHDFAADAAQCDLRESAAREETGNAELKGVEVGDSLRQQIGTRKRTDGFGEILEIPTALLARDEEYFEILVLLFGQLRCATFGGFVNSDGFVRRGRFAGFGRLVALPDLVVPVDFEFAGRFLDFGGVVLRGCPPDGPSHGSGGDQQEDGEVVEQTVAEV